MMAPGQKHTQTNQQQAYCDQKTINQLVHGYEDGHEMRNVGIGCNQEAGMQKQAVKQCYESERGGQQNEYQHHHSFKSISVKQSFQDKQTEIGKANPQRNVQRNVPEFEKNGNCNCRPQHYAIAGNSNQAEPWPRRIRLCLHDLNSTRDLLLGQGCT